MQSNAIPAKWRRARSSKPPVEKRKDETMNATELTLASFPVAITLPVQWGDQDAIGHVNNTTFIRWFESARIAYLERVQVMHAEPVGPILAAVHCNFRQQVKYPCDVVIGARVAKTGRTSLSMQHAVFLAGDANLLLADGDSVVVMFNYETNQPVELPATLRESIAQLEGP